MEAKQEIIEEIPSELNKLAERLDSHDQEIANQLKNLAKAIGNTQENIDVWAGLDLERIFPPIALAETLNASHIKASNVVKILRNISIFGPLVFTWQALAFNQNAGTSSLLSITNVAPLNFVLFLLLIGLTLLHEGYELRNDNSQSKDERQIANLLRRCSLQLSAARSKQPIEFTRRFGELGDALVKKMQAHQEELERVAQTRKAEITDLQMFIKDFKRGAAEINKAGTKLDAAVNSTGMYISGLENTLAALNNAQKDTIRATDDLKKSMNALANSQQASVVVLTGNAVQFKSAVDELNAAYAAARPMMQDMHDTTTGLANVQTNFLDRMATLVQDQQNTYQAMDSLLIPINAAIAELNRVTGNNALPDALDGASSAMLNLQGEIEAFVREQRKSLQLLEEVNRNLRNMPVPVSVATNTLSRP